MTNSIQDLKNARVVVIGGTSGIGQAIAVQASAAGARVTVASRSRQRVDKTVALLGPSASGNVVDLTDATSTLKFFQEVGEIDHLILSGSQLSAGAFRTSPVGDAQASMNSKFWGPYSAVKAANLAATGSIVLFSGLASRKPGMGKPIMTAINAAVEALGKALAVELAPVRVNIVSPGVIDTPLWAVPEEKRAEFLKSMTGRQSVSRAGRPEEIASVVMTILTSTYMTGAVIDVDGGGLLV